MHFNQPLLDRGLSPLLSQERLDVLCAGTVVPPALREAVENWTTKIKEAKVLGGVLKESEHERDFILDIFQGGLGYKGPSFTGPLTLRTQFRTADRGGKPMDGALGHFTDSSATSGGDVAVVVEAKGTDWNLDTDKADGLTAPEQAFRYATICQRGTPKFVIVTNLEEIRLYRFDQRITRFWRFDLLVPPTHGEDNDKHLRELAYLLAPERLLPEGGQKAILDLQLDVPEEAAPAHAAEVHQEIEKVIEGFQRVILACQGADSIPTQAQKDAAWMGGQKLVARMLFTGFANKHGLLQPLLLQDCQRAAHPLNPLSKWDGLQHLFRAMDTGFKDGQRILVPHFNGGLFRETPELDGLRPHPGPQLDHTIDDAFDLARKADLDSGSTLLGRIFEQGLKRFEERTLTKVQDGIVYTPEHIGRAVTIQTLQPLVKRAFAEADASLGGAGGVTTDSSLAPFHQFQRRWNALASLRVIDPACGSGAFLAAALHYLKFAAMDNEAVAVRSAFAALPEAPAAVQGSLLEGMEGQAPLDPDSLRAKAIQILRDRLPMENAIYGVDLHGEAVTYAKLSVWLKGVERADILQQIGDQVDLSQAILPNLDAQFVTGDSLVDETAWKARFPVVFETGGFDAVLGNPPYVKIQDIRDNQAQTTIKGVFAAVARGSFDLYIPFIDLGLRILLGAKGRMGFIAPSLWSLTDYGTGLREVIHGGQYLEGVVHFRDHQVFDDVLTYTALWFFTAQPNPSGVKLLDAPSGIRARMESGASEPILETSQADSDPSFRIVPWSELQVQATGGREAFWPLWSAMDTAIRDQILTRSKPLEDFLGWLTEKGGAFQGIVTGMNPFFHVEKAPQGGANRFVSKLEPAPAGFPLESGLVRQLLDAEAVDRYTISDSGARAIFPYIQAPNGDWSLLDLPGFPQFEAYAKRHRKERPVSGRTPKFQGLENRDGGKHKAKWWEYSRAQNLTLQCAPKLVFPTTVKRLAFAFDTQGCLQDHMRVYGLSPRSVDEGYFLLGVLNASVSTWFAKRISAPKSGGYFEAIDTYLRKYPIPTLASADQDQVIAHAKRRHELSALLAAATTDNEQLGHRNEAGQCEAAIEAILKRHYGLTDEQWSQVEET